MTTVEDSFAVDGATKGACGAVVSDACSDIGGGNGISDPAFFGVFEGEELEFNGKATRLFSSLLVDCGFVSFAEKAHFGGSFQPGS